MKHYDSEHHPARLRKSEAASASSTSLVTRLGVFKPVALLGLLLLICDRAGAMVITTNCTDQAPSIVQPKRIQGACPSLGPLSFYYVPPQPSTSNLYHIFGGQGYYGLGRSDTNGVFTWKLALTNGAFAPGNAAGRFAALQDLRSGSSNITCFGLYDHSGGSFSTLFERRLPIHDNHLVNLIVLSNGTYVVALNRTNAVTLLGINSAGTVLWAKQLTSADFPYINSGDPADPGRSVELHASGPTNFLLSVGALVDLSGTNTSKTVLARFDTNGVVQWAKNLNIPLSSFNSPSSWGSTVSATPNGDALLTALDFDLVGSDFVYFTYLAKVATNGALAWSRKFVGGTYLNGPFMTSTQGSLLLGLISTNTRGVCCLINTNGQVTSLAQLNPPLAGLVSPQAVSLAAGKVYFAGQSGTTPIIGSSSLTLSNFAAMGYSKGPLDQLNLTSLPDERLVFSGTETNGTTIHLDMLNSNLVEQGGCTLFTASTLTTSASTIAVVTNTPALTSVTVTSANLTVSLISTQLQFQVMAFQEDSLCSTNCVFSLSPAAASFALGGGNTNVSVTRVSGSTCPWSVTNPCASWITVSPTNGTNNGSVTITVLSNSTASPRSCSLTIAGQSFSVNQAGPALSLGEAVDAPSLTWTTGGNANWIGQTATTHDGADAAQSGVITDGQQSWIETTVTGPGLLTYWWKVSSESTYDKLEFYVNGAIQGQGISGEVNWQSKSNILASGTNVLRWKYSKDSFCCTSGQDLAWLDQVVWVQTNICTFQLSATNVSAPAAGGSSNVNVVVITGTGCNWTATNPCASWITVSPTNGTGNATVTINMSSNGPGQFRSCTLTIAGQPVSIKQSGGAIPVQLLAGTASGLNSFTLVELQTDPVREVRVPGFTNKYVPTLDYSPDGQLYGVESSISGKSLVRIDVTNGTMTNIGTIHSATNPSLEVQSIAFSPEGSLYGLVPVDQELYLVNTTNALATYVATITGGEVWGIDFAPDGRFFGAELSLYQLNRNTGQIISTNGSLSGSGVVDIDFAPDGFIYGVHYSTRTLYRINPGTGASQVVGMYDSQLWGLASRPGIGQPLVIQTGDGSFGFAGGKFGFNVTGPSGQVVVFDGSTNLQNWSSIKTNTLGSGPLYFSDPQSGYSGRRSYRVRLQ